MSLGEIIGPVMVGPSSSHTAGAARIGNLAASCFGKTVVRAEIYLRGSFASTAKGHGTDKAILAGILGMAPDDADLKDSFKIARDRGVVYTFNTEHIDGAHPNSARLVLWSDDGSSIEVEGASVGGGAVVIERIDGFDVRISGDLPTLVTFHEDVHGVVAKVTALLAEMRINIASLVLSRRSRSGQASMVIELDSAISENMLTRIIASSNSIARAFVLPVKGDEF